MKDIKNTSADTTGKLTDMEPDTEQEPVPPGHEFGYSVFFKLPEINIQTESLIEHVVYAIDDTIDIKEEEVNLFITDEELQNLQQTDSFCMNYLRTKSYHLEIYTSSKMESLWEMWLTIRMHLQLWWHLNILQNRCWN